MLKLVHSDAPLAAGIRPPLVSLRLGGFGHGDTQILGQIDLDVASGETVAITGPSGIGKSTLLRLIAGLEPLRTGTCDRPARCAFVFQEPTLLPWRSVRKNIALIAKCSDDAADAMLRRVGLAEKADLFPGQLSLGQQRRLALARAFATQPELLLMDEPFVSLDAELADEMMSLFEALRDEFKVTTLMVTHAPDEARRLATRVVTLGGAPARIV